ncbi:MAG: CtsR family transcriptional regulator [Dethiobacter sp.]|jgi:transcriptional regulator CtsR|nr:CtsR family transcriptional regulator [Dethiobacter sp.]
MSNLVNSIENYIKCLLEASPSATILLQRKELAERFKCVPSQINYVMSTRFTPERGYLVDSRRGGGGYLRIRRLDLNRERVVQLVELLRSLVRDGITPQEAIDFVERLADTRLITRRESLLMKAAVRNDARQEEENLCRLRAAMLARMLEALLHES